VICTTVVVECFPKLHDLGKSSSKYARTVQIALLLLNAVWFIEEATGWLGPFCYRSQNCFWFMGF